MENTSGEIESLLSGTISQCAGPRPCSRLHSPEVDLRLAIEGMSYQGPIDEIRRRVNRAPREELKGRRAEEICRGLVARGWDDTDRRVGIEAADDRVLENMRLRGSIDSAVVAHDC